MKIQSTIFAFILATFLLTSCGEEIGRIEVDAISTEENVVIGETTLSLLKDDEIAIWSEMDMEYDGDVELLFNVIVLRDDELYDRVDFDPREKNVTVGEVKTNINGDVSWSFTGKNASILIDEDGQYTFQSAFFIGDNSTFQAEKHNIILKK